MATKSYRASSKAARANLSCRAQSSRPVAVGKITKKRVQRPLLLLTIDDGPINKSIQKFSLQQQYFQQILFFLISEKFHRFLSAMCSKTTLTSETKQTKKFWYFHHPQINNHNDL